MTCNAIWQPSPDDSSSLIKSIYRDNNPTLRPHFETFALSSKMCTTYCFFASLSAFFNARFLILSCIARFCLMTTRFPRPSAFSNHHCIIPCPQNGVLVYAIFCAPPLLPTFPSTAFTKFRGFGMKREVLRILDMAVVTR